MSSPEPHLQAAPLAGRCILVAEDVAVIATRMARVLGQAGATVVGPAATLAGALDAFGQHPGIDAAVVDLDLRGEKAYPLCQRLVDCGIRFLLATGYDTASLPPPWCRSLAIVKPFTAAGLVQAVVALLAAPLRSLAGAGPDAAPPAHDRRAEALKNGRDALMESTLLIEEARRLRVRLSTGG